MVALNKCLAQSNKSRAGVPATNKRPAARRNSPGAANLARPVAGSALPVFHRPFAARVERKLNMSCLYSTACVYGVTALTVAIWSIPIGIRDLVFLGLLGLIFLIQVVSSLISPNVMMGLIYILAGVR
jgi:hypothetical protein